LTAALLLLRLLVVVVGGWLADVIAAAPDSVCASAAFMPAEQVSSGILSDSGTLSTLDRLVCVLLLPFPAS
jgi:hypothetical protein